MKKTILKLHLRNYFKGFFEKKLNDTLNSRLTWIRQVRKFSSSFLSNKRKNDLFIFAKKRVKSKIKKINTKIVPKKISFIEKRLLAPYYINNILNRRVAKKNTKALLKFKKKNRIKKAFRKFRNFKFYGKFKKELFRENPLNRFYRSNLQLLSFNYNYLLNFHTAIGNSSKSWINPTVFSKVLAIRNDMILYDLSFTFITLKKGLQSIFQISKFRGSILGYVNLDKNYKFSGVGFDHFLRSWLPGYLTNFKKVIKNIINLQTKNIFNLNRRQRKFLKNIDLRRQIQQDYRLYFFYQKRSFVEKNEKPLHVKKIPSIPSFGFSLEDQNIWVNECQRVGLRTMAVCDSESFPHKIDFPLIGNQKSLPLSFFLVKLVSESASVGKRFDYFSFVGFQFISTVFNRTEKVVDRLLKKTSFNHNYKN